MATSTGSSKGLATKSSAPWCSAVTMFMPSAAEEMKRMGTLDSRRISPHQWKPPRTGRDRSSSTSWGAKARKVSITAAKSSAQATR